MIATDRSVVMNRRRPGSAVLALLTRSGHRRWRCARDCISCPATTAVLAVAAESPDCRWLSQR